MPNPFPGMNPYLESPDFWPEVHNRLMVAIADALVPQLVPKYRVAIEKRIYEIKEEQSLLSSRTQLITQNSGLQALSSKESAKNQCVINSV